MQSFSAGASVSFGWETFKKRPWFFVLITLFITILTSNYGDRISANDVHITAGVVVALLALGIVGAIIQTLVGMGKINLLLKALRDVDSLSFFDLWHPRPFVAFFLTNLVYGLIVIGGLILLIVPGIIWSIKYIFAPYLVIDKGLGVRDALRESARMTDGHKWDLLLFGLRLFLINILGFVCLIVGLLVSVPVTWLAFAHMYRTLSQSSGSPAAPPAEAPAV